MHIYVVDDHPVMREAITMVLRRLRPGDPIIELDRLELLAPAVEKHGEPLLITLDLNLSDTRGTSGVSRVRALFPKVPLAVYSASPANEMEGDCLAAGANVYINKAASTSMIAEALREFISQPLA
jgi:DNA-binding NarL/FixJ family response regulator